MICSPPKKAVRMQSWKRFRRFRCLNCIPLRTTHSKSRMTKPFQTGKTPPLINPYNERKGMTMCTVKEIQEAIREDCKALIFPTSRYVSRRRFAGKFSTFGAVRGPRKWSVLLRKKQARSTQGTRIASEKSLMKQEIIPQGVYLLLFCATRLLMPIRKRTVLTKSSRASAS